MGQTLIPCLVLRRLLVFLLSFGLFLPQAQLLKELEHRVTQEARHRQQLDLIKTSSMEKLLEDVEQQEQHLQLLTEEVKRASKLGQLQQRKSQRELHQVTPGRGGCCWKANQSAPDRAGSFFPSFPRLSCPPQECFSPFVTSGHMRKMEILIPMLGNCSGCFW